MSISACGIVGGGLSKDSTLETASTNSSQVAGGSGVSGTQAFQTSFYTFAQQNCVQCHGSTQSPLFAISNVSTAYSNALPYANFSAPSQSLFAAYAGNGHCGLSNCSGGTQASAALSALNVWAAAENLAATDPSPSSTPAPGSSATPTPTSTSIGSTVLQTPSSAIKWVSAPVAIPSPLPSPGAAPAIMRWALSGLTPANSNVSADIFEIQIEYLTPTTYHLSMPKLASASALQVAGVHVMIKESGQSGIGGEYPLGMAWTSIDTAVTPATIPSPLPKTSLAVTALTTNNIPMPVLSTSDVLLIGFETLQAGATTAACKNLSGTNGFVSNVLPQMQTSCFSCHLSTAGNAAAFAAFPMVSNNNAQLCATALTHVNLTNPTASLLVENPQGENGHPNLSTTFNATPFVEWIDTE
jgi:hypothetical protein